MSWKRIVTLSSSVLLVLVSACSLPQGTGGGQSQDPTAALQTQVAAAIDATAAAQTAFANAMAGTLAAMTSNTPEPSLTAESTLTPSSTNTEVFTATPSATFTATFTPTSTITLTPNAPMVSVSVETNCRSGPGPAYDVLGVLRVGQSAEVVSRSSTSDTWIIKLPSNPGILCWLWGQYATLTGNSAGLPVSTPPYTPTPKYTNTPQANFDVSYLAIEVCGGGIWGIKFKLVNTGSVAWESNRVTAIDQVTSETLTMSLDVFPDVLVAGFCTWSGSALNMEPGETVYTTSDGFSANPSGHAFTATIRLCTLNGMTGTCMEKTITFTP